MVCAELRNLCAYNNVVTEGTATDVNGESVYAKSFWDNQNFGIPTNILQSHAAYLKPKFTLTYNSNGATSGNAPDAEKYADGELAKVASAVGMSKTDSGKNYKADGWNANADGTGTSYAKDEYLSMTKDETLYVKWVEGTPVTHTVTFVNETVTVHTETVNSGETVTAYELQPRTGYTFVAWKNGNNNWDFTQTVTSDITLTAEWNINQYMIIFRNTADTKVPNINLNYGATVTVPENPTRKGYSFTGWEPEIPETMPAQNLDITAQWTINSYTLTFENTGDSIIPPISQTYMTPISPPSDPSWAGYTFIGWDKEIPAFMPAEDITITAQWKYPSSGGSSKTTYTVTFNANGGAGEMFPQTFTSGKEKVLNLNFFTREGYTFAGWATSADGDVVYTDGETIKVTKSMTLYAVWESNEPVNPEQPGDEPENPEKPTEPETPAPILAVLAGLGAAVVLRRK